MHLKGPLPSYDSGLDFYALCYARVFVKVQSCVFQNHDWDRQAYLPF